jgi:predicted nucleic acid-binding protein
MDAFDADALIYAAVPGHPLGQRVTALFRSAGPGKTAGTGSVLLLPEVLSKPLRDGATDEIRILAGLLARLDLRPVDRATAELATALASRYRLKAADATHLATAVSMGADRFITNNQRDFPATVTEINVTYPADLAGDAALRKRTPPPDSTMPAGGAALPRPPLPRRAISSPAPAGAVWRTPDSRASTTSSGG